MLSAIFADEAIPSISFLSLKDLAWLHWLKLHKYIKNSLFWRLDMLL